MFKTYLLCHTCTCCLELNNKQSTDNSIDAWYTTGRINASGVCHLTECRIEKTNIDMNVYKCIAEDVYISEGSSNLLCTILTPNVLSHKLQAMPAQSVHKQGHPFGMYLGNVLPATKEQKNIPRRHALRTTYIPKKSIRNYICVAASIPLMMQRQTHSYPQFDL